MQKILKLCFSVSVCLSGCSSSPLIKSVAYTEGAGGTINSVTMSPSSSISKEQLAEFSKTGFDTDLKNQKIKDTSSRLPVTWRVITPKSPNSCKKRQYNSNSDPGLTDQVFKDRPAKFVTKEQAFLSKSTDYDKTPEEIMNSGDFELAKHREITVGPYYDTTDPLSVRSQEKFEDLSRFAGYRESYRNIDREKALGIK